MLEKIRNTWKQPKEEIEKFYEKKDPWAYTENPEDLKRKQKILEKLEGRHYKRALDIGGGEGWISKDLPADEIEVLEISDNAKSRLPEGVKGVSEATGKYDLIVGTGIMYHHYDYQRFLDIIRQHSSGAVLLSNIASWEVDEVSQQLGESTVEEFPYREFIQRLRFYERI